MHIQTLSIRTCVICVYLTNGENIALVVRTYEHFLFPCTQRGPPLFSLAGRSRLSSIWFSYMHNAQPDRHYIGCNNKLEKLPNKKHVIYLDLGIYHSWRFVGDLRCWFVQMCTSFLALWGRSERGEGSNQGNGSKSVWTMPKRTMRF